VRDGDDGDARLAGVGVEEFLDVERLAVQPRVEARRGQQSVDAQREFHAILRGVEALDVEHAHLVEWRFLNGLDQ